MLRDSVPVKALICLTLQNGNKVYVSRDHVLAFGTPFRSEHADAEMQAALHGVNAVVTLLGVGDLPVQESAGAIRAALHPTTIAYAPWTDDQAEDEDPGRQARDD